MAASMSFEKAFRALAGNDPFPWQEALYHRFMSDRADNIPATCNLPTGLGKTSVVAIWLIALANGKELPRRLVYVVNRRTVVDQTTNEIERLRNRLKDPREHAAEPDHVSILEAIAAQLATRYAIEGDSPLAISTLRGQFADNREWSTDPSRPAVICGTVDMIGSRLLFSGYGVGFKAKPLHAGFLGQDVLLIHDEAHLEPAFQNLLVAIENEQRRGRFPDRHPLRAMELSATSRGEGEVFGLTDEEKHADFDNADAPEELRTVWRRTRAKKTVTLHPVRDEKKELTDRLAQLALTHGNSGRAVLIFVRTVDDLGKVVAKLPKERTQQLTGTMRGFEREKLINEPIFKRFLPKAEDVDQTVYLVCTSAGEVGVNISADHLVCDLTTFESMAQRFGRVNRFGLRDDTRIDIVCPETFDEKDKLSPARQKTLDLLRCLDGNGSPDALGKLDPKARAEAFAPLPVILPTSDILFDAWSMTSIRDRMPGRPPVEPYLHGIRDYEPPGTHVAWREEVSVIVGDLIDEYPPKELLEDYPVKPHELLRDRTDRVWKEIVKLADRYPEKPVWIVDDEGEVQVVPHLSELTALQKKDAESRIATKTILLPHDIGGLTTQGTLDGDFPQSHKQGEPSVAIDNDVADEWTGTAGSMRVRRWATRDEPVAPPGGMKLVCQVVLTDPDDEEGEPVKTWHWFVRVLAADANARSSKSYGLDPHLNDAKEAATRFVSGLSLDPELRDAIILASQFHDLGKNRERWQRGIGNTDYPKDVWAKSGKRRGKIERSPYRHEFGSLLDIHNRQEFMALSEEMRDLVLHLIAAHHGRGRPQFTSDEIIDDAHTSDAARAQSTEVLRRFSRLQRKFGRWGLAYLESLVRAADYAASDKAEGGQK